ncbi:unnamed protein product [Paramecium primaurelia]|uniref:Uncharacterized protein n=1 Tax=Paramecium primaurelia TaxID=5886 RepID=A0A8S1M2H9_PARPR|nr:unnamed protein product [Paramecium primaurelia]
MKKPIMLILVCYLALQALETQQLDKDHQTQCPFWYQLQTQMFEYLIDFLLFWVFQGKR